ncbi:MAG TPA: hypothetical protein VIY30_12525, partial [Burkholderiaceae bacterium]
MTARHRMRAARIAMFAGFALSAFACANLWNFEDLRTPSDAEAPIDVFRRPPMDATMDAGRADADAGTYRRDSTTDDATDATDASDLTDAGDAVDETTIDCPDGSHNCNGSCSSNSSFSSCGPTSCSACVGPVGAIMVTCNGTSCVGMCSAQNTFCDGGGLGECADLRSHPSHCGDCATVCPVPAAGGRATCGVATFGGAPTCGISCEAGLT